VRQGLAEQDEARRDRDRVCHHRGRARGRQGVALLVGRLQDAGADSVPDDERDQGQEPDPAVSDELGGDIPDGEQQAGGEAERRGPGDMRVHDDEEPRAGAARCEPDEEAQDRRVVLGGLRAGDREPQQAQPDEGEDHGGLLAPGQPGRVPPGGREGQDRDSGGGDRLHQGERREPQRRHVHEPARGLGPERLEPPPVLQEGFDRPERAARRKGRQGRGRVVLE
jgi:hypothetical protein